MKINTTYKGEAEETGLETTPWTCVQEVLNLNLDQTTDYHD
jgi:hypothetical protein